MGGRRDPAGRLREDARRARVAGRAGAGLLAGLALLGTGGGGGAARRTEPGGQGDLDALAADLDHHGLSRPAPAELAAYRALRAKATVLNTTIGVVATAGDRREEDMRELGAIAADLGSAWRLERVVFKKFCWDLNSVR